MKQMYKTGAYMAALALALLAGGSAAQAESGYGGGTVVGGSGGGTGGALSTSCFIQVNTPAEGFSVKIAGGAKVVTNRRVDLAFNGGDAARMAVSNSPDFDGVSSEFYVSSKSWTLPEGEGTKTIYVRFYNSCGASTPVVSTSVTLANPSSINTPPATGNNGNNGGQVLGEKIALVDELIARLRFGQRSEDVRALQTELKRLGYFPASWTPTNYYGPLTLSAVTRYVNANAATLTIDQLIATLRYGQTSPNVRRLQTLLVGKGVMPRGWRVTSFYGTVTRAGVNAYLASR